MKLFTFISLLMLSTVTVAQSIRYLALGDSYTIGESVSEKERWPVQFVELLRKQGKDVEGPQIIATTGWRTDNLIDAIGKAHLKNDYDLVSLLIGVNNQYQGRPVDQFKKEFEELLLKAIQLAKGKKENVFVVSIPDYGFTPFGNARRVTISKELDEYNNISKALTEKLDVRYYNITDISRKGLDDPDLLAGDGLHPSGKMYGLWVQRILGN